MNTAPSLEIKGTSNCFGLLPATKILDFKSAKKQFSLKINNLDKKRLTP